MVTVFCGDVSEGGASPRGSPRSSADGPSGGRLPENAPTDAAGRGRRVSEGHHEHEATCPMHANKKGAAVPNASVVRSRVKDARSPGPQTAPRARRVASPRAKEAPVRGAPSREKQPAERPSSTDNKPEWNTSPPERPRRTSSRNLNKPKSGDQSPSRRSPPAKKPVNTKPATDGKSGIPKRKSVGSSAPASNKQGNTNPLKSARKGSANVKPDNARHAPADKAAVNGTENGINGHRDQLSVPDDRPRSGSITGAGKSELGKFLEKLHFEEMHGSSDEEPDDARAREPVKFINTWRTGDGDDETMNALRTKPRKKEAPISPSWNFEDVIVAKKPDKDEGTEKPKERNRYSFLVDSNR